MCGRHRNLNVLTPSFPPRRSSDRKGRVLGASALRAAWPLPAAAQVASAASQAQAMVGKMAAAGLAIATLFLVIAGYFLMTGHGDRQTFALWATGFAVVVCAPAIVALLV